MSKLSILLVPGSFSLPQFYDEVVGGVAAQGYEIRALHMPTVGLKAGEGRPGPLPTMYDDAAFIAKEVEKLADEGKYVVLVGHSYGGVPVTQSVQGLAVKDRQKQGKPGGIIRLAYMTCLVPALGGTSASVLAKVPKDTQLDVPVDETGWMHQAHPEYTAQLIFNHLTPEEGTAFVKQFPKHSSISFINELTYAGYKDVPVSYLLCEDDRCVPPFIQRDEIEMIEKETGSKVDVTSINADHCPMVTDKKAVVDWIVGAAEQAKKEL